MACKGLPRVLARASWVRFDPFWTHFDSFEALLNSFLGVFEAPFFSFEGVVSKWHFTERNVPVSPSVTGAIMKPASQVLTTTLGDAGAND